MFVFITLTSAGADAGPFNLYSDADGFVSPFAIGVSKAALLAGYAATAPAGTTTVRIISTGVCTNFIDVAISATTTTTTTVVEIICGESSSFSGGISYPTTQSITLTSSTGTVVLNYDALNVPDRFIVEWNSSVVIDTGYRGSAFYDFGQGGRSSFTNSLTGLIDPITLNAYPDLATYPDDGYPRIVGIGMGTASFVKNLASNTFATIKVYAPMTSTAWSYTMNCPSTTTTTTTTEPL
jgi:hypothetical protein